MGTAERLYRIIADDASASARDRARASTELARIAWLVDDRGGVAADGLAQSLPMDPAPCDGAHLYGRVLNAIGRAAEVPVLVGPYVDRCASLEPGVSAEVARSWLLVAASLPESRRAVPLAAATKAIAAMTPLTRSRLDAMRLEMDAGLLSGRGGAALAGWDDYLWLKGTHSPQGFDRGSDAVASAFVRGVGVRSTKTDAITLVQVLIRAGFAQEAEWMAADHGLAGSTDNRLRSAAAYLAMRQRLTALVVTHDRAYARSPHEDADGYQKAILSVLSDGARAAGHVVGDDPWPALEELWGVHGQVGVINGVAGVMVGHAVEDRREDFAQGGRKGSIRYVALDNMIENSFSAWLWDGAGGPGGWAHESDLIYQVRPLYAAGVVRSLSVAMGGAARKDAVAEAGTSSASDLTLFAKGEPMALPGLGKRLHLQAVDQIAARARAQGGGDAGFIVTFRRLWWDSNLASSIFLHEGRHVLDQAEFKGSDALSGPELEYRAKLSEIGLGDLPRNALSGILGTIVSPESSHGKANARLMSLYSGWVRDHAGEVLGFDAALPPAVQIDKLTDEQMRRIARGADPEPVSDPRGT